MSNHFENKELVLLHSRVNEMDETDVRTRIGSERLEAIRSADPRPMFVELLAGHEGVSTGALVASPGSRRRARKFWSREMISRLASLLRGGPPVYLSHEEGRRPRRPVGEIVAGAERMARGVLGAAGVAYIRDPEAREKIRRGDLDTCSIEAEIECSRAKGAPDEPWIVNAVRKVTAVALGDSRRARPGFAGASILAVVEEFSEPEGEPPPAAASDDPAQRIEQLSARIDEQDRTIQRLQERLTARETEPRRAVPPPVPAPPERNASEPWQVNPLIPRPRGRS